VTLGLKISLKGYIYRQHLYTVGQENSSATTLPLEVFTQRNFVADVIRLNLNFIFLKRQIRFLSHPLGELGVTHALHP